MNNDDDDDDDDNEMWECIGVEFRLIDNRYVGLYIYECKYYYSDQWNFFRKWYCMKKKKNLFEYTTAYLSNLLRYDNNAL